MPARPDWTIADVLDCEALLHLDEQQTDMRALAERDARLWRERIEKRLAPGEAESAPHVFAAWLAARRQADPHLPQPGTWLANGWQALATLATVGGILAGFAVAGGYLFSHWEHPANVFVFLGATVGVQWLLLLWVLLIWITRGFRESASLVLTSVADRLGRWLAGTLDHLSGEERMRVLGEAAALRRLTGRNAELLKWPPLRALQRFGIAWNLGVLAALLLRPAMHDITFTWESTWFRDSRTVHEAMRAVAAPWAWIPHTCPELGDVESSRYHSGNEPVNHDSHAWGWWLAGCIVFYGLLPRLVLSAWVAAKTRAALKRVSFDEPRHRLLWHRLRPLIQPDKPDGEAALPHADAVPPVRQAVPGCVLIASPLTGSRAAIEQWVAGQLGWKITASEIVEIDFPSGNADVLARLAPALTTAPRWIVAVPARFTSFSAFTQFIAMLAPTKAEGCVLVVGSNGQPPEEDWTRYWRDFTRAELPALTVFALNPP